MYGQGGSFNPHYRHGAPPPPPQAGVTGTFRQQPQPPPPPPPQQQKQQAGVTGAFPHQPVPPPPASYPQHPGMRPPPGPYTHSMPQFQNPAYPFAQHDQMHQMPMGSQQRGFAPMPMSGLPPPLPQAMYQTPQYPMPGPLPPPPPRPTSSGHENVLPPSDPPPPPPLPATATAFSPSYGTCTSHFCSCPLMECRGDEDSPSRIYLTTDNSLPVTAECTRDVNVPKSLSDVSRIGNDLQPGSGENAKTANVTVEGGSPFRLIQGYSSDENEDEVDAGVASTLVTSSKGNKHTHVSGRNTEIMHQNVAANAEGNVNVPHGTEQNGEARKYHLKDESNPVKQDIHVPGHLVKNDLSLSEFDGVQRSNRHGTNQRKRSRSKSSEGRSHSPSGANKCSPSQSSSPGRQSRSPLAKRIHPTGEGKDSGDRNYLPECLLRTEKLDSSSNNLSGKKGDNTAPAGALAQHSCEDNLTSESFRSVAASGNASDDPHKLQRPCPPSQPQSDSNVVSSAGNEIITSLSSGGVPFTSVQATKSSMSRDMPLADPQSLCPPEPMSPGFAQSHPSSSNMIPPPGLPSISTSEFPQTQFQQNVIVPGIEFLQNQMRSYPAPDLSHPRPLDLHDHTLQPVTSHQQPNAIPVENPVPHPDRWSNFSGGIGLPYSHHQSPYGQQQPPGNLDSGTNLVYPSFQRFPSNLPGSSDLGPVSDVGLPKSSIKPHYNPFASTFEQTDPSLGIDPTLSPNAVRSFSTKAEHMSTLSPFGQSFPGSGTHAHESSAEAARNKQKQFRLEFASGAPYDPLIDSIEPSSSSINKVDLGKERHRSATDSRDASKLMNIEVDSKDTLGLGVVAESEVEGLGEVAADTEAGVVENASPEFLGAKDWSSDIPGDIDNDQSLSKKAKDSRSMKLFKNAIADFVKEVLKPSWRQGNMSKEAFKTIVKKTVDKVSNSVPSSHIPKTPAKIKQYIQSSQRKVTKLVMGYVDKYVKL
ncbi:hypothetical protein PR202_ga26599 [Eleusine coracana subsp. coracana]|uniref:SFR19-like C-terminal domain-containing protein n=1 Tax=Eleusine coracana subsp. coracana TaxID=191504 RepID=A0AAV5DE51_ELECO|nr:hypothetical protein PR202_ga26599 [Eleusine coracana subsp. coracana]